MNSAGLSVPGTTKSVVSLLTWPVGAPPGVLTTRPSDDTGVLPTAPVCSVLTSLPLSETQIGVLAPRDMPQAFTTLGLTVAAFPG